MKPKELPRLSPSFLSFSVTVHRLPHFLNIWHYHKAIELFYIRKSEGTAFIGDHIGEFGPGDIFLLGTNLPHMLLNEQSYFVQNNKEAEALVVHFDKNCFGQPFFDLPELMSINQLINEAKVGLMIRGNENIISKMDKLNQAEGHRRITYLLEILDLFSKETKVKTLSSVAYIDSHVKHSNSKLDKAYQYMFQHFTEEIDLNIVAEQVSMNASAFSRFFKKATNKSFVKYLIELRIGYACKLLLEDSYKNVSEVCFECGFNNLSSFNKQFKTITGRTPSNYLKGHQLHTMSSKLT